MKHGGQDSFYDDRELYGTVLSEVKGEAEEVVEPGALHEL